MRPLEIISFLCLTAIASAQAPVNDPCTAPIILTAPGVYAWDNTQATTDPSIVLGFCPVRGKDLWYEWTPTQLGMATFYTCGQTALDSNIAVWANGPCPAGPPMVCDDDACGLESWVTWPTQVGVTYYLQLGRSGNSTIGGTGTFTLDFNGPPTNDDCSTPINLGSAGGSGYDNTIASSGPQGQACTLMNRDLWFTWTATQNGTATIETCGQTADDTALAVYPGVNCPAAAAIGCDDNSCGAQSTFTWPITGGTTYTLQVGSSIGGPGSFTITETGSGSTGTLFCPGDGTGTACPCGNNSVVGAEEGCLSSLTVGGALRGSGAASIAADTFVLTATNVPNGPGLYFQGSAQTAGGAGNGFGDGLLCVGGSLVRMGVVFASGNSSTFPSGALPPVSVAGGAASGNTFHYQLWYRDADLSFCPPASFNLTNAISVTWAP